MRTNVYVDGFNLYYGAVRGTPYKWLNIRRMCELAFPRNEIAEIHDCTALVRDAPWDPQQSTRQQTFIRALETRPEIEVTYGSFLTSIKRMPLAPARSEDANDPRLVSLVPGGPSGAVVVRTEEKGSDVNLATMLVADAFRGDFEVAAVLSTDSDLALPIELIRTDLGLPVGVLFPKKRYSVELARVATFKRTFDDRLLRQCQFAHSLVDAAGRTITKPRGW